MKKVFFIPIFLFVVSALLLAQTGVSSQDYRIDESGKFYQTLRWETSNASFYEVEIERRNSAGDYVPELKERSEGTEIEVMLPPGRYRYRIVSFNVLGKAAAASDWVLFRVYTAVTPAVQQYPSPIEVLRGAEQFTIVLSGKDIIQGAEIIIIKNEKNAVPVKAISAVFDDNDSQVEALFSAENIKAGKYNITMVNPGGLSQTIADVPLKFVRALSTPVDKGAIEALAGPFSLGGTKSWAIGGTGEFFGPIESGLGYGGGVTLRYTFYESYKDYGTRFFIPNSFFVEASFDYGTASKEETDDSGVTSTVKMDTPVGLAGLGFLYKIRIGQEQRFIFNFGASLVYCFGKRYADNEHKDWTETLSAFGVDAITGFSFRFTPAWSLDLNMGVKGGFIEIKSGVGGFYAGLGVTFRRPY